MKKPQQNGFTLIELMVVVAIIGILAAIAYPSYTDSVRKSRRADVEGALLAFANAMERHFTETNSYLGAAGTILVPADIGVPRIYTAPANTRTFYTLTLIAPTTATTYTLSAAPIGAQATDKCGTLTLTNTGLKDMVGESAGVVLTDCW
jgi:type IV pilus assembly protein PilE